METSRKKRYYKNPTKVRANVPAVFRGWGEWKEGDYAVGKYHSHYTTKFRGADQDNWRIQVLECNFKVKTKDGKSVSPVGQILVLNSAGQVNKFMKDVKIGQVVDVTYGGKQKDKDDPTTMYHTFSKLEAGDMEVEEESEGQDQESSNEGL